MDNGKDNQITKKIKVFGIVQGVGFRPLVYRIAKKLGVTGTVRNVGGYVEILVTAEERMLHQFLQELKSNDQSGCEIVKCEVQEHSYFDFQDFLIIHSGESEQVSIIPPDLPVCPECQSELLDQRNRRYHNPFISCMKCGPRYTMIEELPYDRENTSMADFDMCPECWEEYTSPELRRFHAQTISCYHCGPYLEFIRNTSEIASNQENEKITLSESYIALAVSIINSGGIVAVKGIGGYHLVCSPFLENTVQNLRKLKGREEKPFAVMFHSVGQIMDYCMVSEEEQALLETRARPIVLLYLHNDSMALSTNKGSIYCGAFLPYTPLQLLLTKECGPLIMTSANVSNQPIIKEDDVMLSWKSPYLEGVLYNKRRIVRSVDDSVAKVIDGKPQLIRRSRGYVPYPVFISECSELNNQIADTTVAPAIFAAGGDLKATFCLYQKGCAVVSQYIGDLEEENMMREYKNSYGDLTRLLKITPNLAVCDLHPNYYSVAYAKTLGIPLLQVQHHHAHIASVMAEHDLKEKVIGIAFDGTGYGTDGNVWGGEFLICEGADFIRAGQLKYSRMLGGDESMRDAKKTATCYLLEVGLEEQVRDDRKDLIKAALSHNINTIQTSSMGRLFDAVASVLDISHTNRYEGECAAMLEREAVLAQRNDIKPTELSFAILEKKENIEIDAKPVLETLVRKHDPQDPFGTKVFTGALALGFHYALADVINRVCEILKDRYGSSTVALSGGVFQNSVLTELTLKNLRQNNFTVYTNLAVPPNDGGISLGQAYIALNKIYNSNSF